MAYRRPESQSAATPVAPEIPDTTAPPPSLLSTGTYDNQLFTSTTTPTVWNYTAPPVLQDNIQQDRQDFDAPQPPVSGQGIAARLLPAYVVPISEVAFAVGGVMYSLNQLDALIADLYRYAVARSDDRLVELGHRPEGLARDMWHWTSVGLQAMWIPLRLRSPHLRDRIVFEALNDLNISLELTQIVQRERERRVSQQSAAAGRSTQESG